MQSKAETEYPEQKSALSRNTSGPVCFAASVRRKSHDADPGAVIHMRELCPRGRVVLADEENCVAVAPPDGGAPLLLLLMLLNRTFERFALPNAMLELHVKCGNR
jgi:hypothetical protein